MIKVSPTTIVKKNGVKKRS